MNTRSCMILKVAKSICDNDYRAKFKIHCYSALSWTDPTENPVERFTSVETTIINKIIECIFDIWPDSSRTSPIIGVNIGTHRPSKRKKRIKKSRASKANVKSIDANKSRNRQKMWKDCDAAMIFIIFFAFG